MINTRVNNRIKAVRTQLGITQKDFAAELGISRSHISNIENRNELPSRLLIKAISLKYGVSEEWLMNGNGEYVLNGLHLKPKRLPKEIKEKLKRQNKAVFTARLLELEIERWCEKNGIDTSSEEYVAAKASVEDAVSAIDAATIEKLYQKGRK